MGGDIMRLVGKLTVLLLAWGFSTSGFSSTKPEHTRNILVRLKDSAKTARVNAKYGALGVRVIKTFNHPRNLRLLEVPKNVSFEQALKSLRSHQDVLYAEPDYPLRMASKAPMDSAIVDPRFHEQWYLHNEGQTGGVPDVDINAPEAWQFIDPEAKVVVAVIDTGIDLAHPEMQNSLWVNDLEIPNNEIDDDQNGYVDDVHGVNAIDPSTPPADDNGHGSFIAGMIGARSNNLEGGKGIVPNVSIIACKFLGATGGGATSDAIECLNYLLALKLRTVQPVNIVATNNSWGGGGPHSLALYDAIKAHRDAGILFVTVAPADAANNDEVEIYPCNYQLDNIITAAATDDHDHLSGFSSFGRRTIDVGAPGVDIFSTDIGATYETVSGNSFAAASVTGLLGLIAAFDPGLPFTKIRNLVLAGGTPLLSLEGKTVSGRRIRAWDRLGVGSLSCHDQIVSGRLSPREDHYSLAVGERLSFSFININCAQPMGRAVPVFERHDRNLMLLDDGEGADQISSDGIYATEWIADAPGNYEFIFINDERLFVTVYDH